MASWEHITFDQLEEIIMNLDIFSRAKCTALNKEWQEVMSVLKTVNPRMPYTPDHVPPSLFGAMELTSLNTQFGVYDVYGECSYHGQVPGLMGQNRWFGAGEGWLLSSQLVSSGGGYALVNPITNEQFLLTRQYTVPGELPQRCYFTKVVLCRSPEHEDGFLLVGLPLLQEKKVGYLKKTDTAWSLLEEFRVDTTDKFEDAVFHEGKLYLLTSKGNLYCFTLCHDSTFGEPLHLISANMPRSNQHWHEKFLAVIEGQLLSITRLNKVRGYNNEPDLISIHACSIDGPFQWKEVSKIGNFAVFLSISSNAVVVPVRHQSCVQANSLYFAESTPFRKNSHRSPSNMGVYDIKSKLYRQVPYNPRLHFPVWLRPSQAQAEGAGGAGGAEH